MQIPVPQLKIDAKSIILKIYRNNLYRYILRLCIEHIKLKQIQNETHYYIKQGLLILRVLKTACPKAEIAISTAIISSFVCKKQRFLMLNHCILIRYREIKNNINWLNHLNVFFLFENRLSHKTFL